MNESHLVADDILPKIGVSERINGIRKKATSVFHSMSSNGNIYLLVLVLMVFIFVVMKLKGKKQNTEDSQVL